MAIVFKKDNIVQKGADLFEAGQEQLDTRIATFFDTKVIDQAQGLQAPIQAGARMIGDYINPAAQFGVVGGTFKPSAKQISIANKTSRSAGAVGGKPTVVTKAVKEIADKNDSILDFGAGKGAKQSELLRESGFKNVTSHDFGANTFEGVHDVNALSRKYDVVQVSNVLNVQDDIAMLQGTLEQVAGVTKKKAILNYPSSPRKAGLKVKDVEQEIRKVFPFVKRINKSGDPVWEASFEHGK